MKTPRNRAPGIRVIQKNNSVYILYTYQGGRAAIPTGVSVDPKYFDTGKRKDKERTDVRNKWIKPTHPNPGTPNSIIRKKLNAVEDFRDKYLHDNERYPSVEEMSNHLKKNDSAPVIANSLFGIWGEFTLAGETRAINKLSDGTINIYNGTLAHLKDFAESLGVGDFDINLVDKKFGKQFMDFLAKEYKRKNGKIRKALDSLNSVGLRIAKLKAVLNWAIEENKCSLRESEVRKIEGCESRVDVIHLSEEDVRKIFEVNLSYSPKLEKWRDMQLFQLSGGERFSDLEPERWLFEGDTLQIIAKKTKEIYRIPIRSYMREFIEKYMLEGKYTDFNIDSVGMNEYNAALKDIAAAAGLTYPIKLKYGRKGYPAGTILPKNILISSHTNRATFASLAIKHGTAHHKVMQIMGIASYPAFVRYVGIDDAALHEAMAKVDEQQKNIWTVHRNDKKQVG